MTAATVGALVAGRRPRHPVGWLLVAMGLSLSLSAVGSSYKWHGLVARPGTLPAANWLAGPGNGLNILYVACAGFVFLLTPTGRLPSPRWRWWAALAAVALVVGIADLVLRGDTPLFQASVGVCLALLPAATGTAILRYRLYDLDRIILAWGLLTLLLGLGYAAVVLGLGRLPLQQAPMGGVTTPELVAAAAFQPARRWVQAAVDRRFNRRRHDAARLIEAFGARLRDQVDLDAVGGELLAVVDQTMQPTTAWLWQRPRPSPSTAAAPGRASAPS